jgi:hypothetical protein
MEILTESGIQVFLGMVAVSTTLFAQSCNPDKPKQPCVSDARQIVSRGFEQLKRRRVGIH